MREILFRGKRVGFNEWIEGYYFQRKNNEYVEGFIAAQMSKCAAEFKPVYPETVGQYTGLTDKNGKKIFEGDIVKLNSPNIIGIICFGKYAKTPDTLKKTFLGFYIDWHDYGMLFRRDIAFYTDQYGVQIEVIGNIHDNPDLLEVKE